MSQDHQLTFDWILYVILMPPVLFALWLLYRNHQDELRARRSAGKAGADNVGPPGPGPVDRSGRG